MNGSATRCGFIHSPLSSAAVDETITVPDQAPCGKPGRDAVTVLVE
jgi:hypothetical protein